jgi:hypothetical protein
MAAVRLRSSILSSICVASALTLGAAAGWAATVSHSASLPLAPTNWTASMSFPRFDTQLGCLDSVCFSLNGHVQGQAKFESQDGSPATVTMNLSSTVTLQRPNGTTLVVTIPLAATSDNVTAYDGINDYGGTSGRTYSALSADKVEGSCTSAPADLALFSGAGNIVLPVLATGSSIGNGGGNLYLQFSTDASSGAQVTYHYSDCPVPARKGTWGAIKSLYR